MSSLTQQKCQPCHGNASAVTKEEMSELKSQVPNWEIVETGGVPQLKRQFKFDDFKGALDFTDRVGQAAEEEGHHPEIVTEYGATTVKWWTHAISGLHKNDFIMAAKTDELAS